MLKQCTITRFRCNTKLIHRGVCPVKNFLFNSCKDTVITHEMFLLLLFSVQFSLSPLHTHGNADTQALTQRVKTNGSGWFMSGLGLTPLSQRKINVSDELLGLLELILYSTLRLAPFSSLSPCLCVFKPTWVSFFFCRTWFFWCAAGHALQQSVLARDRKHQRTALRGYCTIASPAAQCRIFLSPLKQQRSRSPRTVGLKEQKLHSVNAKYRFV